VSWELEKATFREDLPGLGASCELVLGPAITSGLPTNANLETELISVVSRFDSLPVCGPLRIWRPEIEEHSDGEDDSKADQRAA
jgi:hypothetical protein